MPAPVWRPVIALLFFAVIFMGAILGIVSHEPGEANKLLVIPLFVGGFGCIGSVFAMMMGVAHKL